MPAGNLITLDMGGTTAKASIVEKGGSLADEYEVGGGMSLEQRAGGRRRLRAEAAGDRHLRGRRRRRQHRVAGQGGAAEGRSPQSAGAVPGPACYGAGNEEPTVTDANVVLGYLNPEALAGGTVPIDAARPRAIEERVAAPLGRSLLETAYGIHRSRTPT
jgi:N-methylhydantoinase A